MFSLRTGEKMDLIHPYPACHSKAYAVFRQQSGERKQHEK